ncbi:plasmid pRiA4b ORF-3 family protein [Bosea sp. 47.2.35]|uniref:plasmid pRiA4b ORF-3 family protein n=1 Tax=Bosea sp. 47.2.35 TaxID=2969304 RepID=UPI00214FF4DE|nr:plasmid pRiA4b ORF-3 family protein [Bosea sp. 47.2.35]MCR4522146.1 plasmid pRiA4b ORF-3 family protein [Bosea sp. 47.2.35]
MSPADRVARLKIELDDWSPVIWRRVEVPLTASLKALHDVIQAAMPFEDYHLFQFRADGKRFAIPDPEWESLRDRTFSARTTKLGALFDRGVTQLSYTYDFGDDWRHTVTVEDVFASDFGTEYPRYVDGARRGPPEDVGGIPGFQLFLDAIADPDHEQHDELMRWHGRPFEPEQLDVADIRGRIAKLARRRAIGKAAFAKSRR